MNADERKVNAVLREAERIARKDRGALSGDIIQFPASIAHAQEAIDNPEGSSLQMRSVVARGCSFADETLARVVQSAWEGAKGNKGPAVLGCFIVALRSHLSDVQHILDIARKQAAAEFKFDVDANGCPKCPNCGESLDTLKASRITRDEGVSLVFEGGTSYSYDSLDDGDYGGEINHQDHYCPHCGDSLPEAMQVLIDAMN